MMKLLNDDMDNAPDPIKDLNTLYNSDACSIIYNKNSQKNDYEKCSNFWASILQKGIQQSITQMSVVITSILDDLKALNQRTKTFEEIIFEGSNFNNYEIFMEIFLFKSYHKTVEIFRLLNKTNLDQINQLISYIMYISIFIIILFFSLQIYFIELQKKIFNSFMNFIGILPMKYLIEDNTFYREILKLETFIF